MRDEPGLPARQRPSAAIVATASTTTAPEFFARPKLGVRKAKMTQVVASAGRPYAPHLRRLFRRDYGSVFGNYWELIIRLVSIFDNARETSGTDETSFRARHIHALHKLASMRRRHPVAGTDDTKITGWHPATAISELVGSASAGHPRGRRLRRRDRRGRRSMLRSSGSFATNTATSRVEAFPTK